MSSFEEDNEYVREEKDQSPYDGDDQDGGAHDDELDDLDDFDEDDEVDELDFDDDEDDEELEDEGPVGDGPVDEDFESYRHMGPDD